MIQIDETIIRKLILHRINSEEDKSIISNHLSDYSNDEEANVLKRIFLKSFISHSSTFEFKHEIDINYNVLYKLSKSVYEDDEFVENTKNILQHLISVSKHPNIKDGDLFIAKFEDIKLNNKFYEGLGIFKFEDKESFIETEAMSKEINFKFRKGIGSKKPDKACLIIFSDEPYTLLIIDSNSNETDYWQNEFIKHKTKNDFINNTTDFLSLTKSFVTQQIPQDFKVSKTDQIDLLNRSVEYFKSHDNFDKQEFENEVLHHTDIINSFRDFDESYRRKNELEQFNNFEISQQAVKKQARVFKRVLKLDKF